MLLFIDTDVAGFCYASSGDFFDCRLEKLPVYDFFKNKFQKIKWKEKY